MSYTKHRFRLTGPKRALIGLLGALLLAAPGPARAQAPSVADDGSTVDLLVLWTPAARGTWTEEQMRALVADEIATCNSTLRNSQVNLRVQVVVTQEIDYKEPSDASATVLDALNSSTPESGDLREAQQLANEVHADFIILLAKVRGGIAGGNAVLPRDENGWFFQHELGHLLGGSHEWFVDGPNGGRPEYAHDYVDAQNGKFRTVIAYGTEARGVDLVFAYSNPNLTLRGFPLGVPAGTKSGARGQSSAGCDADNARYMNEQAKRSAGVRSSLIEFTGKVDDTWGNPDNWVIYEGFIDRFGVQPASVGRTPRSIDNVLIPAGKSVRITGGEVEARDVTLRSGATLVMEGGSFVVSGNFIVEGAGKFQGNAGTVALRRDSDRIGTLQVNDATSFRNLTIGDADTKPSTWLRLSGTLNVRGDLTLQSGAVLTAGSDTLNVGGDWINNGGGFDRGNSTVVFNASGAQTIRMEDQPVPIYTQNFNDDRYPIGAVMPGGIVSVTDVTTALRAAAFSPNGGMAKTAPFANPGEPVDKRDSWLFIPALALSPGQSYEVEFAYSMLQGDASDFEVHLGNGLLPSTMTTLIHAVRGVTNTKLQKTRKTFEVGTGGAYNLGFRNLDLEPPQDFEIANLDDIVVRAVPAVTFANLAVKSGSTVTTKARITVTGRESIEGKLVRP